MPKGKPLPPDVRRKIYNQHCLGESVSDIAQIHGLNENTIRRVIREERKAVEKEAEMARSNKIVKKLGNRGKLIAFNGHGYEATVQTADGKSHRWKFESPSARTAEEQFEKWVQDLDDECEFMRKVERKVDAVVEQAEPEVVETDGAAERIANLEQQVRGCEELIDDLQRQLIERDATIEQLKAELEQAKAVRIEYAEGFAEEAVRSAMADTQAFLLWAKTDKPKAFGLYRDEDAALAEAEKLNEVAAFLGTEGAFDIEPVEWRG